MLEQMSSVHVLKGKSHFYLNQQLFTGHEPTNHCSLAPPPSLPSVTSQDDKGRTTNAAAQKENQLTKKICSFLGSFASLMVYYYYYNRSRSHHRLNQLIHPYECMSDIFASNPLM